MADTICKTVRQYNKETIPEADMCRLKEIAEDYCRVKNYVYRRYGRVGGLSKLYPGYTVQNEMTKSGLRERLGLPSVYFYCAVFDALGDIKAQWSRVKEKIQKAVKNNDGFTPEDAHYIRFVLKAGNCFEAVLNHTPPELSGEVLEKYAELVRNVDTHRLDNYLRRQARKHLRSLCTDATDGFSLTERAYRYGDHGIYIATKEKRKRIFVPLTDNNQYKRQIYIRLEKESCGMEICVPVNVRIKSHRDYRNEVGISLGARVMLTTDNGRIYGERLGELTAKDAEWVREQTKAYRKNGKDNSGRKKYLEQKRKRDERLHAYINAELNRFLQEEKPGVVFLPKLPAHSQAGRIKKYNYYITMWRKGYIRERLSLKCREQSVKLVEVFGKDISSQCSVCGNPGRKEAGRFSCPACGLEEEEKTNAARNARKRGMEKKKESPEEK